MLAVARAMMVAPRVLMLDEPSAGLSPKLVGLVFAKLAEIRASGVAILLVEQNARAGLALADRALVLVEGRRAFEGPAADLRGDPGLIAPASRRRPRPACARAGQGGPMNLQFLADGVLMGAVIGLGAIGLTLTYSILRFANFAHGEFISWGAYLTFGLASLPLALPGLGSEPLGPFSFGWAVILAGAAAMVLTGGLALVLDAWVFRRLRRRGNAIVMVIASFGASLALRSLLEFLFTSEPRLFQHATCRSPGRSGSASGSRPTSSPCWA